MQRYEYKFVFAQTQLSQLLGWIRLHPEGFKTAFPDRLITSIYFDSELMDNFFDNMAGAGVRSKLRVRWYGSGKASVQATLERKGRNYNTIDKHSVALNAFDITRNWTAITHDVSQAVPAEWSAYWRKQIRPTLITRYQRKYFVSRDQKIRLTIDTQLAAFDQNRTTAPQYTRCNIPDAALIVELKAPPHNYTRLQAIAAQLPARRMRYSKYVNGLSAGFL